MKAIITICDDISAMSFNDIEVDTDEMETLKEHEISDEQDWKQLDDAQRYRDLTS